MLVFCETSTAKYVFTACDPGVQRPFQSSTMRQAVVCSSIAESVQLYQNFGSCQHFFATHVAGASVQTSVFKSPDVLSERLVDGRWGSCNSSHSSCCTKESILMMTILDMSKCALVFRTELKASWYLSSLEATCSDARIGSTWRQNHHRRSLALQLARLSCISENYAASAPHWLTREAVTSVCHLDWLRPSKARARCHSLEVPVSRCRKAIPLSPELARIRTDLRNFSIALLD